jgi:gamma-glutamyltranspeptidase
VNTAAAAYARGGILTPHDLANYSAVIRTPTNISQSVLPVSFTVSRVLLSVP